MERSTSDHLDVDRTTIFHPYTSLLNPTPTLPVASASGATLTLETGEELIDGMSSWWACVHGYNNPALNAAVTKQLSSMSHVMFGGLTHRPGVALGDTLCKLTGMDSAFICDSGSISVEIALKMALQYHRANNNTGKSRFITVEGGYHGDTFGAMSVCDPVNGMHSAFEGVLPKHVFCKKPGEDPDCSDLSEKLEKHSDSIAALVIEPIVQGAGGMRFYPPSYLNKARELCDAHDVILIFDEIATGFGRAGEFWAKDYTNVMPDIMCIGKALTGGYMTLAATLSTLKIAQGISKSPDGGVALPLMHGPTFTANPLACAVALESINLLLRPSEEDEQVPWWKGRVDMIGSHLEENLAAAKDMPHVVDVRVMGAIGVVEMDAPLSVPEVTRKCVELGCWFRPFGNNMYTFPPYVIEKHELEVLTNGMLKIIEDKKCRTV
ncbi:hypothetical protein TL16_g11277 [Triparma laevis f. inornata]|uniref:Diaminopelargonic acid synthase n=1 Tax=Triparma laevis f. inornata TaxID=1714386 RepID=A0A9W7ET27_9STRA|nr:hypothetical protein TL16_g11277 [Triparma laevis f. inornata]